jgi:hypothetical protein
LLIVELLLQLLLLLLLWLISIIWIRLQLLIEGIDCTSAAAAVEAKDNCYPVFHASYLASAVDQDAYSNEV